MLTVHSFCFNPFQENTWLLTDTEAGNCAIIDPGCCNQTEEQELRHYIEKNRLTPVLLLNTHCHIDHILGNYFVASTWNLPLHLHLQELMTMQQGSLWAQSMGLNPGPPVANQVYVTEGDSLSLGSHLIRVLFTPGHSVASVSFYAEAENVLIAGDVLFKESIGRTDLPGGDFETLAASIRRKLYTLPPETKVYPGHGPATTIGHEMAHNPFVKP